jgi:hypothetical protein
MDRLINLAAVDQTFALDLIDAALDVWGDSNRWTELDRYLSAGASAWKVAEDHISLTRVVSDEAQATFDAVTSVADAPTAELKEAWANAFGRNGDPSDAWEHAIKGTGGCAHPRRDAEQRQGDTEPCDRRVGRAARCSVGDGPARSRQNTRCCAARCDASADVAEPRPARWHRAEADTLDGRGPRRRHARGDNRPVAPRRLGCSEALRRDR